MMGFQAVSCASVYSPGVFGYLVAGTCQSVSSAVLGTTTASRAGVPVFPATPASVAERRNLLPQTHQVDQMVGCEGELSFCETDSWESGNVAQFISPGACRLGKARMQSATHGLGC